MVVIALGNPDSHCQPVTVIDSVASITKCASGFRQIDL